MQVSDLIKYRWWRGKEEIEGIVTFVWGDGYIDVLFDNIEATVPEADCEVVNESR